MASDTYDHHSSEEICGITELQGNEAESQTESSLLNLSVVEEEPPFTFKPPLYFQRYDKVKDIIQGYQEQEGGVAKVIDFGCAECKLIRQLKSLPFLTELVGVDIDKDLLIKHKRSFDPMAVDYVMKRSTDLTITLYHGSIGETDSRLQGYDVITLVEVIEHLYDDTIAKMKRTIFEYMQPKVVIITTPNEEFNVVFPNFSGFRHWDHKFEWTRKQFQNWCDQVCTDYPEYVVTYDGIGNPPDSMKSIGCCSQMAVLTLKLSDYPKVVPVSPNKQSELTYEKVHSTVYPGHNLSDEELLNNDIHYHINSLAAENAQCCEDPSAVEVLIAEVLICCKKWDIPLLSERCKSLGYTLTSDQTAVIMNMERPSSECSSDSYMDDLSELSTYTPEECSEEQECWD